MENEENITLNKITEIADKHSFGIIESKYRPKAGFSSKGKIEVRFRTEKVKPEELHENLRKMMEELSDLYPNERIAVNIEGGSIELDEDGEVYLDIETRRVGFDVKPTE